MITTDAHDDKGSPIVRDANGGRQNVVLSVMGACVLDRILTVSEYPQPDSKVRASSSTECGGGNAANTAVAAAALLQSIIAREILPPSLGSAATVQLLTKLGNDSAAERIVEELSSPAFCIDLTSPLFLRMGAAASSTSSTTVLVDEKNHTRTCVFSPGSCGELTHRDVEVATTMGVDPLFPPGVRHFHSDSRHVTAAARVASHAKHRHGMCVSVDVERDRFLPEFDELLSLADVLFCNNSALGGFLERRWKAREEERERLEACSSDGVDGNAALWKPDIWAETRVEGFSERETSSGLAKDCLRAVQLLFFFNCEHSHQENKEVVLTRGGQGSLRIRMEEPRYLGVRRDRIEHVITRKESQQTQDRDGNEKASGYKISLEQRIVVNGIEIVYRYTVHIVGVMDGICIADTTGAGDAFIGGYIVGKLLTSNETPSHGRYSVEDRLSVPPPNGEDVLFCLRLASWVAGMKLGGVGARSTLPSGKDLDESMGEDLRKVRRSLDDLQWIFK